MRPLAAAVVLTCALLGAACDEDSGIEVKNIDFKSTKELTPGLKRALATKEGSWLPWGPKKYFDRSRFDADLKRIQAFYADHGYPDARVQSADVQMNEKKKDAVSITVHVSEGEPVIVEEVLRRRGRAPGVGGETAAPDRTPSGGCTARSAGVCCHARSGPNAFRDRGYLHATVVAGAARSTRSQAAGCRLPRHTRRACDFRIRRDRRQRQRWPRGHPPAVDVQAGDPRISQLQESQRRLYNLELFEFANVETLRGEGHGRRGPYPALPLPRASTAA